MRKRRLPSVRKLPACKNEVLPEVEETIGAVIVEDRRLEGNLARKERYHCHSLDAAEFEGSDYGTEETPEVLLVIMEKERRPYMAFSWLSKVQKRRILMLADGISVNEIVRREGVHHSVVSETVSAARKNLKSFSEKHPTGCPLKSSYEEMNPSWSLCTPWSKK